LWAQLLYINEWANDAEVQAQVATREQAEWLARVRAAYSHAAPMSEQLTLDYEPR
jgi:hypothetical protein